MILPPPLVWHLRRADRLDAERCTALAFAAKAHWGYPASWLEAWAPQLTILPAYIDQHRVTVACDARDILGVCAIEDHQDHWMLEHVWIAPPFQRHGIGRALVLDALDAARRLSPMPVCLLADPFAQEFYARLGARMTGWVAAPMDGDPSRRLSHMEFSIPTRRM
jgi:GNAT superfamily N-acetyltransferase